MKLTVYNMGLSLENVSLSMPFKTFHSPAPFHFFLTPLQVNTLKKKVEEKRPF